MIRTDEVVKIVDEASSVMAIPEEVIIPMQGCDHSRICRFSGKTSDGYKSVQGILKPWADEAQKRILQGTF